MGSDGKGKVLKEWKLDWWALDTKLSVLIINCTLLVSDLEITSCIYCMVLPLDFASPSFVKNYECTKIIRNISTISDQIFSEITKPSHETFYWVNISTQITAAGQRGTKRRTKIQTVLNTPYQHIIQTWSGTFSKKLCFCHTRPRGKTHPSYRMAEGVVI